jgi:hypothetical protein
MSASLFSSFCCSSIFVLHQASNQTMKPTAPFRCNSSVFAPAPCRGLSLSR